ncbi:MAG: hypothetical protein IT215_09190 [Chitinophagaceae bacterium]|nr:hypothetical protein [Chitinophagaceae bacterium]
MDLNQFANNAFPELNFGIGEKLAIVWENCCKDIREKNSLFDEYSHSQFSDFQLAEKRFWESKIRKPKDSSEVLEIAFFYFILSYFANDEIKNEFKIRYGFTDYDNKYFISLKDIKHELDKINLSSDVRIQNIGFLKGLNYIFILKKFDLIQHHFDFTQKLKSGNIYSNTYSILYKFTRNYTNALKGNTSIYTGLKYRKILPLENFEQYYKWLRIVESSRGNNEKTYLKDIINDNFYFKCSTSKFYQTIFDLLKLILPYEGMLSYDEFHLNKKQSEAYNADYKRYQYMKVKLILQNTKKNRHF